MRWASLLELTVHRMKDLPERGRERGKEWAITDLGKGKGCAQGMDFTCTENFSNAITWATVCVRLLLTTASHAVLHVQCNMFAVGRFWQWSLVHQAATCQIPGKQWHCAHLLLCYSPICAEPKISDSSIQAVNLQHYVSHPGQSQGAACV